MMEKLPVYIDNNELLVDKYKNVDESRSNSYGYVSILNLVSLIITIISLLLIIIMWNR